MLRSTLDAGMAVATNGEQGPIHCSDRPLQVRAMQPSSFTSFTSLQETASITESHSLYSDAIVGTAVKHRGGIRFLTPALAESAAIFAPQNKESVRKSRSWRLGDLPCCYMGNRPLHGHRYSIGRLVGCEGRKVATATIRAWWR